MLTDQISLFIKNVLPVLSIIFIGVLAAILLTRLIVNIWLHLAMKKYQKIVKNIQDKKQKFEKVLPKTDEALFIKKEVTRELVERIPSKDQEQQNTELAETKIVDIVKPMGFWTSMILGQKLTYLVSSAQLMNQNSKRGFWVSMVEAQEQAAGRQKGRSL